MRLTRELGREPTEEEMAGDLGISLEQVRATAAAAPLPSSLDIPVGDEEEGVVADLVPDDTSVQPEAAVQAEMMRRETQEVLEHTLNPRERLVLQMRFGLGDGHIYPLEKIGEMLGITRERVRQIEARALEKLRDTRETSDLLHYLR